MTKQTSNKFEEVTIESEPVYKGKVISLQVDQVMLPNGNVSVREIVKHPGGVGILALLDDQMIVVEQYRKPLEKSQIEIPAGKLDPGENPLDTAKRELREETGYEADDLRHVCSFYTSPGFANEILHLYVAENLQKTSSSLDLDEDEFLDCYTISIDEARKMIKEGAINDAKTITAVYAWQLYQLTGEF